MIKRSLFLFILILSGLSYGQTGILLVSLPDKDTIDHKHPVFNWYYAPTPQGRDVIRYNYVLTELKKNQSALSGVTVNQPLMRINGVAGFQFVYPYDAPELEFGKRYGWQLEKTVNNVIVEKSEAWEFILYKPIVEPYKYVTLSTQPDATQYEATGGKLFFTLKERYNTTGTKCYIYDSRNKVTQARIAEDTEDATLQSTDEVVVSKTGSNFYELDVRSLALGNYRLLVVNAKGQKYQLNFLIK